MGSPDIQYAATRDNILAAINRCNPQMGPGDHLFIFVIDHGGTIDHISKSYINLWGNEILHDYELSDWLMPLIYNRLVTLNIVLGQCFSGGFIDDFLHPGCVITTASAANEYSYAFKDSSYDKFVNLWTNAINGSTTEDADIDNNGKISMNEAFSYAKRKDLTTETPQYKSTPDYPWRRTIF